MIEMDSIKNNAEEQNIVNNSLERHQITPEKQNRFLETTLGKTINTGLEIGLRMLLPDFIENQVIDIKDTLLTNGLKAGIDKAIESAIDFGKSTVGIVTGKFDNIAQVENAVEKGGILDSISGAIDFALNLTNKKGLIPKNITSMIKNGKNILLDNVGNGIERTLTKQIKGIENIDKYTENWNTHFKEKDFDKMDKEYKKIKEELTNLIPLENTLKKAREVENLHLLIKNKGQDFNISPEEMALAKKLN